MIDAPAVVVAYLNTDAQLTSLCDNVWADTVPTNYTTPYTVVRARAVDYAVPPTTAYDRIELQVDVVADTEPLAGSIAARVRHLLQTMRGTYGTAVVPAVDVVAATRIDDTTSSPARPRWVIAVEVTAKS